jgi:hypothetical protein
VFRLARGVEVREEDQTRRRGESDIRAARLFSEEEKEEVTIDLMSAITPLPGWEEGTAMGAIVDDWRGR